MKFTRLNLRYRGAAVYEAVLHGVRVWLSREWTPGAVTARGCVGGSYKGWHTWHVTAANWDGDLAEVVRRFIPFRAEFGWDTLNEAKADLRARFERRTR